MKETNLCYDIRKIARLNKKVRRKLRRELLEKEKLSTETIQEKCDLGICNLIRMLSGNHHSE